MTENNSAPGAINPTVRKVLIWAVPLVIVALAVAIFVVGINQKITFQVWRIPDDMFSAVKVGRLEAAYNLTSSGYRKTNPQAAFETFMTANPFIGQFENTKYDEPTISGDKAQLTGVMTSGGKRIDMKFELVRQGKRWLIEKMSFSGESQPTGTDALVQRIYTGVGFDSDKNSIVGPTETFKSGQKDIYGLISIIGAKKGMKIEATVVGPQGNDAGPITVKASDDGQTMPLFKFTKPEDTGWDIGTYNIRIKLDGNPAGEQRFTVE